MLKFNFPLTFALLYVNGTFLQIVLFWNYVPFIIYLILLVNDYILRGLTALNVLILIGVFILNLLYQLYLWTYAFFSAQDVSMGKLGVADYDLNELFTDWRIKFKLLIIRIYYYIPLVIVLGGLAFNISQSFKDISQELLSGFLSIASLEVFSPVLFITVGYYLLFENFILPAALFQYSYTNSLKSALNVVKIMKFIYGNTLDLIALLLLNMTFYMLYTAIFLAAIQLLTIPIIGIVLISILNGFFISWHVTLVPSLHGQIWRYYSRGE